MAIETIVFFAFALLCEYNFFCGRNVVKMENSDSAVESSEPDVEAERKRALKDDNKDAVF